MTDLRRPSVNPFDQQKRIPGISKVIAVGSGKGGVGKSTVSSNLAITLARKGFSIGLLDADIYGPSLPSLFGCLEQRPDINEAGKIKPLLRFGVKLMSMGFLIDEDQPVIWRGPMLFKAMDQFLHDVEWGELDYLIVDLPPGTGDIALTLAQKTPIDSAIVVSTPQSLALTEVKKAIMMFKQIGAPVKCLVQNMSGFESPHGEILNLFPEGNVNEIIENYAIPNLLKVPFDQKIGTSAEAGIPYSSALKNKTITQNVIDDISNLFS